MVEFDKYGRIKNRNYRPEPLTGLRHTSTMTYRSGFWARFDDIISDIGYWFGDNAENIGLYLTYALAAILFIIYVVFVIHTWIDDGFFMAIIAAVIGGVVGYYGGMLALGIVALCMQGVCLVLRLVFKNAAVFTTIVLIAIGVTTYYVLT